MQCPIDGSELVMTERSGVEIDYCPKCRGVWLDRGELDKIIDRVSPGYRPAARRRAGYEREAGRQHAEPYRKKKREGFLGDLFDF